MTNFTQHKRPDMVFLNYGGENQFGFAGNIRNKWIQEENSYDYVLTKQHNPHEENYNRSVSGEITAKRNGYYGAFVLNGCYSRERIGTFRTIASAQQAIDKRAAELLAMQTIN